MDFRETSKTRTGLWKRKSKKTGDLYLGGGIEDYWVHYYKDTKEDRGEKDAAGTIVFYDKADEKKPISVQVWRRTYIKRDKEIPYLSGRLAGKKVTIFPNTYGKSKNDRAPDYNLIIEDMKEEGERYAAEKQAKIDKASQHQEATTGEPYAEPEEEQADEDNMPF